MGEHIFVQLPTVDDGVLRFGENALRAARVQSTQKIGLCQEERKGIVQLLVVQVLPDQNLRPRLGAKRRPRLQPAQEGVIDGRRRTVGDIDGVRRNADDDVVGNAHSAGSEHGKGVGERVKIHAGVFVF